MKGYGVHHQPYNGTVHGWQSIRQRIELLDRLIQRHERRDWRLWLFAAIGWGAAIGAVVRNVMDCR